MKTIKNCFYLYFDVFPNAYKFLIWKTCISVVNSGISIANLYFLRYAINNVQSGGKFRDSAIVLGIMCAGIIISQVILSSIHVKLNANLSYELQVTIKKKLFSKALSVDLSCYEDTDYYNKYTFTMSQCAGRINGIIDMTANFISSLITLIFSGMLSLIIDPITLLFAFLPFVTISFRNLRNKITYDSNHKISDINRQKGYVLRVFYQNLYAKDIRTTNIRKPLLDRFRDASDRIVKVYKHEGLKVAIIFIIETFVNKVLSEYAVLIYASWKTVVAKTMQYGDCLIIVSTLQNIYDSINDILEMISSLHENSLYAEDLCKFLEDNQTQQNNKTKKNAVFGDIIMKNVSFSYPGSDKFALNDIDIHIKKGEKVAIVGQNGAGKSTLIKLLLGLYTPTEGDILLNGDNYNDLILQSIRDMYSVVLQDFKHFSLTVKENVELGIESDDETVSRAIEKSGLSQRISMMSKGINSLLDKEIDDSGEMLSGGEQQKLALSHVYLKNSDIVILDEPASALDPISEHEMYERMLNMASDKTVILISHRLSSTVNADRIIYLENGCVAECGTYRELIEKNGLYAELFRIQSKDYQEI